MHPHRALHNRRGSLWAAFRDVGAPGIVFWDYAGGGAIEDGSAFVEPNDARAQALNCFRRMVNHEHGSGGAQQLTHSTFTAGPKGGVPGGQGFINYEDVWFF